MVSRGVERSTQEDDVMNEIHRRQKLSGALLVALLGVLALMPTGAQADRSGQVLGATIGEWSAEWWTWLLQIPADRNPLFDPDGSFCAEAQRGPVWFLAGSWIGEAERTCAIPKGSSIFFPIANYVWVQTSGDDPANTETDYRQCVSGIPGGVLGCGDGIAAVAGDLEATLDGEPIVFDYRTPIVRSQSPLFMVRWPLNNVFGVDPALQNCANCRQAVSDGFWVMLPPLSPGVHTLWFRAGDGTSDWQNLTYHLIVTSKGSGHH